MNFYPPLSRIAGRYEVASRPLLGGMGVVYLCYDHQEDRPVALKTFKAEYLPDRDSRDRFLREGNMWIGLGRHPHIVHAHGVERIGDGREVYLVLEQIAKEQGRTDASLRSRLTPGRPLPVADALLIALQIVRGLKHASERIPGFVHRDLKPENVLVGADRLSGWAFNRVRVTDFGLAAILQGLALPTGEGEIDVRHAQLTRGLVGTPLYMAPEQWTGEAVSAQTDMYALGLMLYEMLNGQRAVDGRSLHDLKQAHRAGALRPWLAEVPVTARTVADTCLQVAAGERYWDWTELEHALAGAYETVSGQAAPGLEALQVLVRDERVALGWAQSALGASYLDLGKADVALGFFERARDVGVAEGERALAGAGLNHLGLAYADLGDARRAIELYEQALVIVRLIGDRQGEDSILGNLGTAYARLGDARRAINYYEQALVIDREIDDRRGEAADLGNLGLAYADLGDARRAINYYEQALAIDRELGDRHGEGADLGSLGAAYADLGDAARAMALYNLQLVIVSEIGDRRGEAAALGNLGAGYATQGETARAIALYNQQLIIMREIGDRDGEGAALGNLGVAHAALGDTQRAIALHEQALAIDREIGDRHGEGATLVNLGNASSAIGDARRAINFYEQALAIDREIGDRHGEGNALGNLGAVYTDLGDAARAIDYYRQALAIRREIGDAYGVATDLLNMALLQQQQGDTTQALPLAQEAARLFLKIGHAGNAGRAQRLAAQLQDGTSASGRPTLL